MVGVLVLVNVRVIVEVNVRVDVVVAVVVGDEVMLTVGVRLGGSVVLVDDGVGVSVGAGLTRGKLQEPMRGARMIRIKKTGMLGI